MRAKHSAGLCVAGILALGVTAFAQSTGQSTASQPQSPAASSADQQVTITGCVEREADYRKSKDAGHGGVAGTGVGVGNEFVLTDASLKPSTSASSSSSSSGATGTSGTSTAESGSDYELTGSNEGQLSQYVGKRVEITGQLKAAEMSASGQPTGGATAGKPPSGMDVTSKDLKLRELEVGSVREASGTCPSSK